MTRRGATLLLASAVLVAVGWRAHWPELVGVGVAGVALVVLVLVVTAPTPRGSVRVEQGNVQVVRGQPAKVSVVLAARGPRQWLRLVVGPVRDPVQTIRVDQRALTGMAQRLPVDTSARGQRPLGPYTLVHGDPWGVVQRPVAASIGGTLTVRPRSFQVRRSLTTAFGAGDAESASRRSGDQHFHALRDYVLGDEPRSVHWRSSARAGKLVVRQQVSAASTGTTIVLDVDSSAYMSGARFGVMWDPERFERAVEVAASLASSQVGRTEQVHLLTSARDAPVTSASVGVVAALLDALSVVQLVPPVDVQVDELPALVARTRAAHTIFVTSQPSQRMMVALRRIGLAGALTVVRVGAGPDPLTIGGARVIDVVDAESLDPP